MEMNFSIKITTQAMLNSLTDDDKPDENMMASPMSVNLILNMLTIGTVGQTKNQLMKALELDSVDEINRVSATLMALTKSGGQDGGPIIRMVNGMWSDLQYPFKDSYLKHATEVYEADVRSFDFQNEVTREQARQDVNAWVEKATNDLIQDLIGPGTLSEDARIVKANALYFKGIWQNPFEKSRTRDDDFYLLNGQKIEVPIMIGTGYTDHYFRSFDDFKLLRLPYECDKSYKKRFSMYVFLPHERHGLTNLLKKFNSDPSLIHTKCNGVREIRKTWIPKFQILFTFKPSEIMKQIGVDLPFKPKRELTNMAHCPPGLFLVVSTILQKSYVEVNEEGTEAASATYESDDEVGCSLYSPPPPLPPVDFIADHPFLFAIKEDISGAVLFIGAVVNPILPMP